MTSRTSTPPVVVVVVVVVDDVPVVRDLENNISKLFEPTLNKSHDHVDLQLKFVTHLLVSFLQASP